MKRHCHTSPQSCAMSCAGASKHYPIQSGLLQLLGMAASVCKESLCWFHAGMPHSSCSRAPAELINHFQEASQMDELGFRLRSLQNNLAWPLRLPIAMGGRWQPCCGHVPGPVTQHLLHQVPANISGRGKDLHWCCSAARTPEDCWP